MTRIRAISLRGAAVSAAAAVSLGLAGRLDASPYASGVTISGTTVTFTLNEPADLLQASINGGTPLVLNGSTTGTKTFSLGAPTDTFTITAKKVDSVGFLVPTGSTVPSGGHSLRQPSPAGGLRLISSDTNPLGRFTNGLRGVGVNTNPNTPNFGTTYLSNGLGGTTTGVVRTTTDGIYGLRADQSDAFGFGNAGQNPGGIFDSVSASGNSPFRLSVAASGEVLVADWSDANGNAYHVSPNLSTGTVLLEGVGGPTALPAGQNHGGTSAVYAEGSLVGGNLVLYTLDEDLTSNHAFGTGSTTDRNSLWRYNVGGTAPFDGAPSKINTTNPLTGGANSDLDRGADGKFYLSHFRNNVNGAASLFVLSSGGVVQFNSLTASRDLLGATAEDILSNIQGHDVSDDQKWIACILHNNDIAVIPLVNGIPDLANRIVVDTGADTIQSRDIAFDAAGNLHYASSGQGLYRVLSPGGDMTSTLSWDGSMYTFSYVNPIPEPAAVSLAALAGCGLLLRRRRRQMA